MTTRSLPSVAGSYTYVRYQPASSSACPAAGANTASPGTPLLLRAAAAAEAMFGRRITLQVVADQRTAADRHRIAGGGADEPVVDARELHAAVVELAFLDDSVVQVDLPTPQHRVASEITTLAPHLGIPEDFEDD